MNKCKDSALVRLVNRSLFYFVVSLISGFASGCASFIDEDCATKDPKAVYVGTEEISFEVITNQKCNKSGVYIEKGERYKFTAERISPLVDGGIADNPVSHKPLDVDGFNHYKLEKFGHRAALTFGQPFRPIGSCDANYFEIVCTIGHAKEKFYSIYKGAKNSIAFPQTANKGGELFCLVNDFPYFGRYDNNRGSIEVTVKKLNKE